jgi:hypothetical protein
LEETEFNPSMRHFSIHHFCLFVSVAWAGCGAAEAQGPPPETQGQTYRQAIELMCDVDKLARLSPDDNPITLGQQRNDWMAAHVENPDGIFFQTVLSVKTAKDKAALLRKEIHVVGLDRCALVDSLEQEAREDPEAP